MLISFEYVISIARYVFMIVAIQTSSGSSHIHFISEVIVLVICLVYKSQQHIFDKKKMKPVLISILFIVAINSQSNSDPSPSCDCDYHSGGCIISKVIGAYFLPKTF